MYVLDIIRINNRLAAHLDGAAMRSPALRPGTILRLDGNRLSPSPSASAAYILLVVREGEAAVIRLPENMVADWGISAGDRLVIIGDRLHVDTPAAVDARAALAANRGRFATAMEALGDE